MIGFLSDFGGENGYVAQMKAVASQISDTRFIDISHEIPRHDIKRGSFILNNVFDYFPKGSVFVGVVDPGVGTNREPIAVESGDYYFVGPNNGLLHKAAIESGFPSCYVIENSDFCLKSISSTFDGRDVFAPIGAYLTNDINVSEVGSKLDNFKGCGFGEWRQKDEELVGEVIFSDSFGNLVSNIPFSEVSGLEIGQEVLVNGRDLSFLNSYGEAKRGELLLTVGGHGYLELAANKDSAEDLLGIYRGDELIIDLDK